MAELKEDLKKMLAETFNEMTSESTAGDLSETVARLKKEIETQIEAETVGTEFLEKLKDIAGTYKQLCLAEQDVAVSRKELSEAVQGVSGSLDALQGIVDTLLGKIDDLGELKKLNLELEHKVLTDIEDTLKKSM
jgi:hypothetical protein